ncbi:MAG: precorrin-3B C(17)-methyltransferase [Actinobacteria bacterium]|nr:precorrin-3B C(17)-methyltransferase [Actinomycetota bacterium]
MNSYYSLTAGGALLALRLRDRFGGQAHLPRCHSMACKRCDPFDSIAEALPEGFRAGDTLICVMAAGIVFRVLAPLLESKQDDPAVIVIDEHGKHVVPLLGGHAAGANALAREIADFLGGEAVITTSSDVQGMTAPDELARRLGLTIDDATMLRHVTALLVDHRPVCIESRTDPGPGLTGYTWISPGADLSGFEGRLLITHRSASSRIPTARLIARSVTAGVGCRRGTPAAEIIAAIDDACGRHQIERRAVGAIASIDQKHDEAGLLEAASALGAPILFFAAAELAALNRPGSDFVAGTVGTPAVCEPAALLAAGEGSELISGKEASGRVTVALALRARDFEKPEGRVLVVGTGAGTSPLLTAAATTALRDADVIMGYRTYIDQVRAIFPDKEYLSGSMGAELDRCSEALEKAREGQVVAMVSSGDPGVYGMAGPLLELADDIPVEIVPGVTAAQIAAARLGAPLMNDYITLSLSDLLTPREEVLRRARLAAESDLVVCLYNPTSKKRQPLYEQVCGIIAEARDPDTPAGWVRAAGSPEESSGIVPLSELPAQKIDMRTIIILGNSRTFVRNGRMLTGRGYERKKGKSRGE